MDRPVLHERRPSTRGRSRMRRPKSLLPLAPMLLCVVGIGMAALASSCAERRVDYNSALAYRVCKTYRTDPAAKRIGLTPEWRKICAHD